MRSDSSTPVCPEDPTFVADADRGLDNMQITTRSGDFAYWIEFFSAIYPEISRELHKPLSLEWIDNAANILNATYWDVVNTDIRPKLKVRVPGKKPRIDHHKIMSVIEIIVMNIQPIAHDDEEDRLFLNALFALYIAKNIMMAFIPDTSKTPDLEMLDDFDQAHTAWLMSLAIKERNPYFSNSATWYCYELFCLALVHSPEKVSSLVDRITALRMLDHEWPA